MDKRGFWLRFVAFVLKPLLFLCTKRTWHGRTNIPALGGVIIVPNHISYADPLTAAHFIYDQGRTPRFLAKQSLFEIPVVGFILKKCGQIPVQRRTQSAADSLKAAREALQAGGAVIVYPEGTVTKDPDLWPMRGKTGAVRLALMSGASIIPIAQWGAQELIDPFTKKIHPRRVAVTVSAGPPVDLSEFVDQPITAELLTQATDVLMRRLRDDVAVIRHEPSPNGPLFDPTL